MTSAGGAYGEVATGSSIVSVSTTMRASLSGISATVTTVAIGRSRPATVRQSDIRLVMVCTSPRMIVRSSRPLRTLNHNRRERPAGGVTSSTDQVPPVSRSDATSATVPPPLPAIPHISFWK